MAKFKIGDIIQTEGGNEGTIKDIIVGNRISYAIELFGFYSTIILPEDAIHWPASKVVYSRCECGSKHDRHFPFIHSFWCPEWRKE